MKIKFVIAAALMLSVSAYAQKDEIKAIKRIDGRNERLKNGPKEEDMQELKAAIDAAETKLAFADKEQQIEIYFYKGKYYMSQLSQEALTNPAAASEIYYNMKSSFDQVIELEQGGKDKYSKIIKDEFYSRAKAAIVILADKLVEGNELALASQYYYTAYGLDETDHYTLYKAAAYAVNAKDYKKALDYYVELDKTGWTGEGTSFTARNKASGKVEGFPNKASRDAALLATHDTPEEVKIPSVKGEILRNIALLYIELGQESKAKDVMANARKLNPDDVGLIVSEANIYINAKDYEGAKKLIAEAVAKQPNNADLFYSLGNLSAATNPKEAEGYYKKVTELQPNNFEAYARLGDLVLQDEQKLTDQMNALGNSAADNKKYAELKKQKDANYHAAVGYYEKAYNIKKDDQYVIGMLTSLYQALEMEAKYQEFKAKKQ